MFPIDWTQQPHEQITGYEELTVCYTLQLTQLCDFTICNASLYYNKYNPTRDKVVIKTRLKK